ncbi:MAG: hypothetical protein HRU20_04810 [Pseudomonadales bacterium]|nr:hypothetical protein [Pseudomonadales bacterium]
MKGYIYFLVFLIVVLVVWFGWWASTLDSRQIVEPQNSMPQNSEKQ